MMALLVILLGVVLEIVKANGWFVVPDAAIYTVFGIGGFLIAGAIVNWFSVKRMINKTKNRFNRF